MVLFIITFLLLHFPTYSSQQSGCILFLFLVSSWKGIYSKAPFLLKLSCKHHWLVDDQLIDHSTMRVLKRHRREDTFGSPLTCNIWFLFLFCKKENIWFFIIALLANLYDAHQDMHVSKGRPYFQGKIHLVKFKV